MLRFVLLLMLVAAVLASPAVALCPPVIIDDGSSGWSCRWNPYADLVCNGGSCRWVGRFEWYDPVGNSTGERCA